MVGMPILGLWSQKQNIPFSNMVEKRATGTASFTLFPQSNYEQIVLAFFWNFGIAIFWNRDVFDSRKNARKQLDCLAVKVQGLRHKK